MRAQCMLRCIWVIMTQAFSDGKYEGNIEAWHCEVESKIQKSAPCGSLVVRRWRFGTRYRNSKAWTDIGSGNKVDWWAFWTGYEDRGSHRQAYRSDFFEERFKNKFSLRLLSSRSNTAKVQCAYIVSGSSIDLRSASDVTCREAVTIWRRYRLKYQWEVK